MKITNLLDNKTSNEKLNAAHGLSILIETTNHKILFDLGPNEYYKKNAKKLGISLSDIDYLVISHGHNDHGTGIKKFMKKNPDTDVFISSHAFESHVKRSGRSVEDIGIGKAPKSSQLHLIDYEKIKISDKIVVLDKVIYQKPVISDSQLMVYDNGQYIEDHFDHEIYLVVTEGTNHVLFTGCSHKGIDNIITQVEESLKHKITHVVGGLHLSHYNSFNLRQTEYIHELGQFFTDQKNIMVYACHCTGDDAFYELKQKMKADLQLLKTGTIIEI